MVTTVKKSDSGVYYAEKDDGEVLAEHSSVPDSVIQAAFDETGHITFDDAQYVLSLSGATPLKLKSESKVVASRNAVIQIPYQYAGDVFEISNAYQGGAKAHGIHIDGFSMKETGALPASAKLWNGVHMIASDPNGMSQIKIENMEIGYVYNVSTNFGALNAFLLEVTATNAWIRDTIFRDIVTYSTVNSFVFKKDAVGGIPSTAIQRLFWQRCTVQANGYTDYGWKGIDGEANQFYDCFGYDFQNARSTGPKIISQFLSTTKRNVIVGGVMTGSQSPTPRIHMDWQCPDSQIFVFDSFLDPIIAGPQVSASKFTTFTPQEGIYTLSTANDGKTRVFNIPHGQSATPTAYDVKGLTRDALVGPFAITAVDGTNITITYTGAIPPPSTASNTGTHLKWYWKAKEL